MAVLTKNLTDTDKLKILPKLPDTVVARVSFTYYSEWYPTREDLVDICNLLESEFSMRTLVCMVNLATGVSWTDPSASFEITVTLQGNGR